MSNYRRIPARRRRSGPNGCLIGLVVLIWVVLAAVLGYQYVLRQQVSQQIGQRISEQLGSAPARTTVPGAPEQPGAPGGSAVERGVGALPTLVASLPTGEIRVTEEQANAYLAEHAAELQPIESATVRFVPGQIQADLTALGSTSTASMGAAIQAGRIVAINPRIDGPLAALVDLDSLIGPLQQQLNDELAAQGRRVTDVRVETGALVFTVE